ncbi:hypothetical protein [Truepera radiovictrix]|uniref:Uncharacterized protein n=1 Tax=Truepera radiovictrix (strain DSM 17093 / CIP 108686 / LMG 22925 / RQ-24) TaxID=649638 RepID=D7CQS3_TRURR|nr:hypothetical protein [Truepera radiovictrix]ADI15057.1 hypothetical protein Trad_1942 [Truepera radiovictrix DSM 17093]WMT56390.1 hypothetical protein RCV51_10280 [Truepera radiovictrix]
MALFWALLVALLSAAYAVVNVFGAWLVSRRKPWVAGLFMAAALTLAVAAAAFVSAIPYNRPILALGLVGASLASLVNARVVIGRVVWRNHLLRALFALGLYALAELTVRYPL